MRAEELERSLEATVGRGRWFVASEAPGFKVGGGYPVETLLSRRVLERRPIEADDPRRVGSIRFEYMLRPR